MAAKVEGTVKRRVPVGDLERKGNNGTYEKSLILESKSSSNRNIVQTCERKRVDYMATRGQIGARTRRRALHGV